MYMVFELLSMDLKKLLDKAKEVFTAKLIKVSDSSGKSRNYRNS